jgi:hypothetical protein
VTGEPQRGRPTLDRALAPVIDTAPRWIWGSVMGIRWARWADVRRVLVRSRSNLDDANVRLDLGLLFGIAIGLGTLARTRWYEHRRWSAAIGLGLAVGCTGGIAYAAAPLIWDWLGSVGGQQAVSLVAAVLVAFIVGSWVWALRRGRVTRNP